MGTHESPTSSDRRCPPCWCRTRRRTRCPSNSPPCHRGAPADHRSVFSGLRGIPVFSVLCRDQTLGSRVGVLEGIFLKTAVFGIDPPEPFAHLPRLPARSLSRPQRLVGARPGRGPLPLL